MIMHEIRVISMWPLENMWLCAVRCSNPNSSTLRSLIQHCRQRVVHRILTLPSFVRARPVSCTGETCVSHIAKFQISVAYKILWLHWPTKKIHQTK